MIFQNLPDLSGKEKEYVLDCLETNWISAQGPYVKKFEEYFAAYCGAEYGVSCSSGTASLHLALVACGIGPGDEVIVPDFTLIANSNMVILAGARPVFVDIDPETWCLDPAKVEELITDRTKAIICVHMFGNACEIDAIAEIARPRQITIIEDACQAHGTVYRDKKAGVLGDVGCFSFYATKTLTTGEGGLLITDNPEIAEQARTLRSHGFIGPGRTYVHNVLGFNYRLTNIQAAIGLAQSEQLEQKVQKKQELHQEYYQRLSAEPDIVFQEIKPWVESSYWNVAVKLAPAFGKTAAEVIDELGVHGIQTRSVFQPLHSQPVYASSTDERFPDVSGSYPVTEDLSRYSLCLPSGLTLTDSEIESVVEALLACRAPA